MKKATILIALVGFVMGLSVPVAFAADKGKVKSKFYDFSDTVIDGEIKKPTNLYIDARQKVNFDRLLKLKKSFMPALMRTSKEKVFK